MPDSQPLADLLETLDYIIDMVEQLAHLAARHGAKDLASDLFVIHAEARRRSTQVEH